jgi:transcriptional regulator with XRE-family HTH domain
MKQKARIMTAEQLRAGRALLRWSAIDLVSRSGVSYSSIARAEASEGFPSMQARNLASLKAALEAGGVVFIEANSDGGPGVRLRK